MATGAVPVPPGTNDPVFRKQLEFRKMLNRISEAMSSENLKALKHLCYDFIPEAKRDAMEAGVDVFNVLIEQSTSTLPLAPSLNAAPVELNDVIISCCT